jgi:hypothetical protein
VLAVQNPNGLELTSRRQAAATVQGLADPNIINARLTADMLAFASPI